MLGQALALIYFPARLLLRKLEGEGSKYFAGSVDLTALSQTEESSPNYKRIGDYRRWIRALIRSRRGECRGSRSRNRALHPVRFAPNTRGKVRCEHALYRNNAGTRRPHAEVSQTIQ
jgi:hypothetical protein